jgi:hypothetical protein
MKLKKMAAKSQSRDAITDEELNEIEREVLDWSSNRTHVDRSRLAIQTILRLVRDLRAARLSLAEFSAEHDMLVALDAWRVG